MSVTFWQAILLGALQGLTEFLPVSSSAHLILVQRLLPGFSQPGILFDVMLHVGTLVAVVVYFREKIGGLLRGAVSRDPAARRAAWKMALLLAVSVGLTGAVTLPLKKLALEGMDDLPRIGLALLATSALLTAAQAVGVEARRRRAHARGDALLRRRPHRRLPVVLGHLPRPLALGEHDHDGPLRGAFAPRGGRVLLPPLGPDDPRRGPRRERQRVPGDRAPRRVRQPPRRLPRRDGDRRRRRLRRGRGPPASRRRHEAPAVHRLHARSSAPRSSSRASSDADGRDLPDARSPAPPARRVPRHPRPGGRSPPRGVALLLRPERPVDLLVRRRPRRPSGQLGGTRRRLLRRRGAPVLRLRRVRPAARRPRPRRRAVPLPRRRGLGDEGARAPRRPPHHRAPPPPRPRASPAPRRQPRRRRLRGRPPRGGARRRPQPARRGHRALGRSPHRRPPRRLALPRRGDPRHGPAHLGERLGLEGRPREEEAGRGEGPDAAGGGPEAPREGARGSAGRGRGRGGGRRGRHHPLPRDAPGPRAERLGTVLHPSRGGFRGRLRGRRGRLDGLRAAVRARRARSRWPGPRS